MSVRARSPRLPALALTRWRASGRSLGDGLLFGLCVAAALLAVLTLVEVAYQVITGSQDALSKFGLGFIWHSTWSPPFSQYGAGVFVYGTLISSAMAMLLAMPIGVSIGIFLALLAPAKLRAVIGPLVELLAAVPSVIIGLWGLIVLAPFVQKIEPGLNSALGFIPLFGAPQTTGASVFTGGLVLTIMIVPIIASLSRDLFLTVPGELQDGAAALGATRWEVIRGVVLPTTASGVIAASVLGLGRALGEAIAVTQVIGNANEIHANLFAPGDTLASRLANLFPGTDPLFHSALFYLALVLLVIGLITNLFAQWLGRRFDVGGQVLR
ncbi:MAG: phosphate transport system permease protein [Solirubrobacteraceae bacterium]|nr:phosphate transport system permease protein [Solirubrobacteraceae bacterium]